MSNIIQFPVKKDTWAKLAPMVTQFVIEKGYSSEYATEYTNNFKPMFEKIKFNYSHFQLDLPVITEREKESVLKVQEALNDLRKSFDTHLGNIILTVIDKDLK
tara:strand:- start:302 stop:610 length:309 start_codon:yes stop_codon:yes gene_type:complete